jgi:hypothetical protein
MAELTLTTHEPDSIDQLDPLVCGKCDHEVEPGGLYGGLPEGVIVDGGEVTPVETVVCWTCFFNTVMS